MGYKNINNFNILARSNFCAVFSGKHETFFYLALVSAVAFSSLIAGCSGGSDDDEGTGEGFYFGQTNNGRDIFGPIPPNGAYYVLYTDANHDIAGVILMA